MQKTGIDLSILICSLNRRKEFLDRLKTIIKPQLLPNVEVLCKIDDGQRTIGEKRQQLLEMSCGRYIAYVDDDDRISDDYVDSILSVTNSDSDIISFDVEISENGGSYKKVKYHMRFEHDKDFSDHYERIPNHLMAVKKDLAIKAGFPGKSFAEDYEYALRLKPLLITQKSIDKTLYYYDFNEKTSETRN